MARRSGSLMSFVAPILIAATAAFAAACGQGGDAPGSNADLGPEYAQSVVPTASPFEDGSVTERDVEEVAAIDQPTAEADALATDDESQATAAAEQAADASEGEADNATQAADPLAGRIAYVTPDLKIKTVNPDGTDDRLLTRGAGRYSWPTWAPDGATIAYPAVVGEGVAVAIDLLATVDGTEGDEVLYRGDPDYAGILVAPNLPHYMVWSPDGEKLALITGGEAGLEVYVDDLQDEAGPEHVASQAPVYFSWSHTSRYLLVHRGGRHVLVDTEPEFETADLPPFAAGYRVPAWWPSNELMTLIERNDQTGVYGVHFRDLYGETRFIIGASPRTAYLWSPDGEWLAVGRGIDPRVPAYDEVIFVSPEGEKRATTIDERVIAFAWSPDGSKLAYVTVTGSQLVWGWNVMDMVTGSKRRLAEFVASEDMRVWLQFFDQFVYSHGIWSPDSRAIVFTGSVAGSGVGASVGLQQQDQVIVLTVGELPTLNVIGEGRLAFWSPK